MKTTPLPKDYTQEWTTIQGIEFSIPEGVFIPRPDTENWLLQVMDKYNQYFEESDKVIDLCSGAGLICGMIKSRYPTKNVLSLEYNPLAIQAQIKTFKKNNLDVDVRLSDLLSAVEQYEYTKQWILISNPPYVPEVDKEFLRENNIEHEPLDAIFGGGKNGLDIFKRILEELKIKPLPTLAVFELDPRNILQATKLTKKIFPTVVCRHISDMNGWHRALVIEF